MLHRRNPNRVMFFCGILLLSLIIILSYIPGYFSYNNNKYQPSLMNLHYWKDNLQGKSLHFGWHSYYYIENNEHYTLKSLDYIDNDLYYAGIIYFTLSLFSLFLFILTSFCMFKKNKICLTFGFILSWIFLLSSILIYSTMFYDKIINEYMKKLEDDSNVVLDFQWRLGIGLVSNCCGLLLLPLITIMICV